jgi:hypothetical protein
MLMVEEKLDCRGFACPLPVLKVKEVIDRGDVAVLWSTTCRERKCEPLGMHGT